MNLSWGIFRFDESRLNLNRNYAIEILLHNLTNENQSVTSFGRIFFGDFHCQVHDASVMILIAASGVQPPTILREEKDSSLKYPTLYSSKV